MLTSPSNKSYIGQTIRSIEDRFEEHQRPSSCIAIYRAIQKHGWENFEKHWYEVPDEDLNDHEELMIEVLGTLVPCGYNLKEGGSNGKLSEEVKRKISEAHVGMTHTEDTKQKIRELKRGKTHTEETKQKMSEARAGEKHPLHGKTHTDESRQKMSEAKIGEKNHLYGKTRTEETKRKISETKTGKRQPNANKVYQYDINGVFIQSFASSGEAAAHLSKSTGSSIHKCAKGERKSAYGYWWSFTKV